MAEQPIIRTLSEQATREIGRLIRRERQRNEAPTGEALPPNYFDSPLYTRLFRTQGDDPADENDATYPAQSDGNSARLPGKFLRVVYSSGASDPVTLEVIDDDRDWYIYSPFGWIPRLVDLQVSMHNGLLVPVFVPILEVTISEVGGIASGASGEVTITKHGAANGQTMDAWFNHMDAGTAGENAEAVIRLMEAEKKWRIHNLGCE